MGFAVLSFIFEHPCLERSDKERHEIRINIMALLLTPSRMSPTLRRQHQHPVWLLSSEVTILARTVPRIRGGGSCTNYPGARRSVRVPEGPATLHIFFSVLRSIRCNICSDFFVLTELAASGHLACDVLCFVSLLFSVSDRNCLRARSFVFHRAPNSLSVAIPAGKKLTFRAIWLGCKLLMSDVRETEMQGLLQ